MADSKETIAKKQHVQNLKELYSAREAAAEKNWLKGNKTGMQMDLLAAGREKIDKK